MPASGLDNFSSSSPSLVATPTSSSSGNFSSSSTLPSPTPTSEIGSFAPDEEEKQEEAEDENELGKQKRRKTLYFLKDVIHPSLLESFVTYQTGSFGGQKTAKEAKENATMLGKYLKFKQDAPDQQIMRNIDSSVGGLRDTGKLQLFFDMMFINASPNTVKRYANQIINEFI